MDSKLSPRNTLNECAFTVSVLTNCLAYVLCYNCSMFIYKLIVAFNTHLSTCLFFLLAGQSTCALRRGLAQPIWPLRREDCSACSTWSGR